MKLFVQSTPSRPLSSQYSCSRMLLTACLLFFLGLYSAAPARAQLDPPLPPGSTGGSSADCSDGDTLGDESPTQVDIIGDTANGYWSGIFWYDADFLHFGLRVNGDPSGTKGFDQKSWVALVNVPGGDPFQYQYVISLNGNNVPGFSNDTVELWENDSGTAEDISFSPIFNDPAETNLTRIEYNDATLSDYPTDFCFGGNTLACSQTTTSTIGGDTDYLIFWALPFTVLDAQTSGAISASNVDEALFFLATSADANNFNKDDIIDCPFAPPATLSIDKSASPNGFTQGGNTDTDYTIVVTNTSGSRAVGVVVEDDDFDACLTFGAVTVAPSTGTSVVSNPPTLRVEMDELAAGSSVTVTIPANVAGCTFLDPAAAIINIANTFATNAPEVTDGEALSLLLPVELTAFEAVVDGRSAMLRWETASEINNAGFEVQHRYEEDADDAFETLDWVEGHGTTLEAQSYRYQMDDLMPGRHVFRLKQIDFDGSFEYSPQIELSIEMPEAFLVSRAYPNPFNPQASFSFGVAQQQEVVVALFNVLGQRVLELYRGVPEGGVTKTLTIDASGLQSGTYLLRVQGERFADTQMITLIK